MELSTLFDVTSKVALVTGGSRGIGRMIAEGLVGSGVRVYIVGRDEMALRATADELAKAGYCRAIRGDVSTDRGCRAIIAALAAREDALHILVNNAGITSKAPFDSYPDEAWEEVLAVNLRGVFDMIRAALPLLQAAPRPGDPARVINIGSTAALRVAPLDNYAYAPSKAAVHHLSVILAKRFAPMEITVNVVAPGPFETEMLARARSHADVDFEGLVPLGRVGGAEDITGAVLYLSSRAGAFVTGTVIPVDGGLSGAHL